MGKPNVSIANPETEHVPPSQQSAQGPVPKPGELLVPKERKAPETSKPRLVITPSKES